MQGSHHLVRRQLELVFWNLIIKLLTALKSYCSLFRTAYGLMRKYDHLCLFFTILIVAAVSFFLALVPISWMILNINRINAIGITPDNSPVTVVIFHVDQMDQVESPTSLVSTWTMLIDLSKPGSLTFKPLHLDFFLQEDGIEKIQLLTNDGQLSPDITNFLQHNLSGYKGYIILDDLAVEKVYSWFTDTVPKTYPVSENQVSMIIREGIQLRRICMHLKNSSSKKPSNLLWETLEPGFLQTDLEFDQLLQYWQKIASYGKRANCEVMLFD